MFRNIGLTFVQMSLFFIFFLSLRSICIRPEWHTELSTGGLWWFGDLTAFDPYFVLPILTGTMTLILMELQPKVTGIETNFVLKWFGRCLSIVFIFFRIEVSDGCQSLLGVFHPSQYFYDGSLSDKFNTKEGRYT